MPTGKITYFEGDIKNTEFKDKFGFYYVRVTTPVISYTSYIPISALIK